MKQPSMLVVVVGALIGSTAWGQQPLKAAGQDAKPWVLHDQNELSGVAVDLMRNQQSISLLIVGGLALVMLIVERCIGRAGRQASPAADVLSSFPGPPHEGRMPMMLAKAVRGDISL